MVLDPDPAAKDAAGRPPDTPGTRIPMDPVSAMAGIPPPHTHTRAHTRAHAHTHTHTHIRPHTTDWKQHMGTPRKNDRVVPNKVVRTV